jgi:hypothetical protein
MYESAGKAMSQAADQTVDLAKQTPHRVVRELYEQFIAYVHTFVQRIPSYSADDHNVGVVSDAIGNGLNNICSAITYRSAPPLAPLVAEPPVPSKIESPGDPTAPQRFVVEDNSVCSEWSSTVLKFSDDTAAWRAIDPNIPSTDWTPDQKAINDAVAPVMSSNADKLESLGRQSGNPVLEDFAVLAAQYRRGFVAAIPAFSSADNFMAESAAFLVKTVDWACKAAG